MLSCLDRIKTLRGYVEDTRGRSGLSDVICTEQKSSTASALLLRNLAGALLVSVTVLSPSLWRYQPGSRQQSIVNIEAIAGIGAG